MTRKKKDKEKMSDESIKKEEAESSKEGNLEKEKEEKQDVKLLEGEEQKVLEYHDLDDLIAKYNKLKESNKKDREALIKNQKESESWKNKHMRLQAEFENAQKRWNKNRQNLRTEYTGRTLKSFLSLYDSFKKALDGDDVNDPFDYSYHEALSSLERDDLPNNSIIEIIQDGWKIDKNVLRFAKVIISREPAPPEPEPESESEPEVEAGLEEEITQEDKESEVVSNENEKETHEETAEAEKEIAEPEEKNQ